MSPEQAVADKHLDHRTDIYSLGCVLYEMLIGETPYTGRSAQAIVARRMTEPLPRMRSVRDVPEVVEQVIAKALARAPADRFADAPVLADALAAAAKEATTPAAGPAAARRAGRRRYAARTAGVFAGVALAFGLYHATHRAPAGWLDPNLVAVAPFDVPDPSLHLWREGLVDVLSSGLDGVGPLRTVSQSVVLRRWHGRADRSSAAALGSATGAGFVLFGNLLSRGADSVVFRASLLDRSTGSALAEFEAVGREDRIGQLADSVILQTITRLGRGRSIGAVRQVSLGSRSLPTLKEFLRGEQYYRAGQWDSALAHYHESIAQDSGFALAQRRMGLVLGWNPPTAAAYRPAEEFDQRAYELNHGLGPRDSLLIAADSAAFAAAAATDADQLVRLAFRARRTLEEAVRRYPDHPEVWYHLGESRYHSSPPIGAAPRPTFDAFSRAIALDSGFSPEYRHLMQLSLQLGRPDLARLYAARYLALDPTSPSSSEFGLALRLMDPSRARLPETTHWLDTASIHTLFNVGIEHVGAWADTAETAVRVLRALRTGRRDGGGDAPWVLDTLMWDQYLAGALAYRGHLRDAYSADRRLLHDASASPFSWFFDPFLVLSLLGVVPDSVARVTFARALVPDAPWGDQLTTPRHLRGLPWWLQQRDTLSLARFVTRASAAGRKASSPYVVLRTRLLGGTAQAFLELARGDSTQALRTMRSIPDTLCLASAFAPSCFYLYRTLAQLLAARGEVRQASDLLDRWRWETGGPGFVLATLESARLAEQLGRREDAVERFRLVTEVWRRPDPELMPYVTEAREALERLAAASR
jgi:serine/threonine-protein kinase